MLIKSKLNEQDFINVNFVLLYSKISAKIFTLLISFFLIITFITVIFIPKVAFTQIILPLAMLMAMPLITYFGAKRNFAANARISEAIEYQFNNNYLSMKGESFNSQLSWDKIYKVTQTKNWILIWQNRQIANPINKRDVWEGDIDSLKEILEKHKVKNNL